MLLTYGGQYFDNFHFLCSLLPVTVQCVLRVVIVVIQWAPQWLYGYLFFEMLTFGSAVYIMTKQASADNRGFLTITKGRRGQHVCDSYKSIPFFQT